MGFKSLSIQLIGDAGPVGDVWDDIPFLMVFRWSRCSSLAVSSSSVDEVSSAATDIADKAVKAVRAKRIVSKFH